MFGKLAQRFLDVGALVCGAARPTPPATWDVASQIAPCGAGKSNRKRKRNNAFSSVMPVFLFVIASALREAHDGSGPATAGAWGRHQPPHPKTSASFSKRNRLCFIKQFPLDFMPARASLGMQHPMLPWGVGRAAPQNKHTHLYARKGILWD